MVDKGYTVLYSQYDDCELEDLISMQPSALKLITNFVITCLVASILIFAFMTILNIAAGVYVRSTVDCEQFNNNIAGVVPQQCMGNTR